MGRTISFPGLGLEFSIAREALVIGPFTIYWYGILVVGGIALGMLYALRRSREFGIHPDRMMDIALYSVVAGLVGARLYYVAFSWDYYSRHPEEIIRIWEGGIALYGGVIGAFLMAWLLCRRWKTPFLNGADCAVGGLILGQAIGRWGNFVNIEAFGGNTTLPWGMTGPTIVAYLEAHKEALGAIGMAIDPTMPVHPTFFYESIWNLIGFLLIVCYTKRRRFNGELSLFYCGWYGLGRVWIEGLRTDSLMWGSLRISQVLAGVGVAASLAVWLWLTAKAKAGTLSAPMLLEDPATLAAQADAMMTKPKPEPSDGSDTGSDRSAEPSAPDAAAESKPTEELPQDDAAGDAAQTQEDNDGQNH
ncbi:MAG: prolipoprotein diacylglyceryl transferase [Oscillospiraceae bacterium]